MHWLRDGLNQKRLAINDATASLHTVDGTLFLVSPGIFRRYLQEHPKSITTAKPEGVADWQAPARLPVARPESSDAIGHVRQPLSAPDLKPYPACTWACPYKTGHQLPVKLMLPPSA
ncbi:conjugal transfer nickase/helicase domain-containing protein [Pseudomonas veronii]|uniref:conjugal transfer nickase/helicase domain-containing protein n=1 Tax=Pseudomonas veronii TaxID=76761 RepID=UPI00351F87E7